MGRLREDLVIRFFPWQIRMCMLELNGSIFEGWELRLTKNIAPHNESWFMSSCIAAFYNCQQSARNRFDNAGHHWWHLGSMGRPMWHNSA